MRSVLAPTLLAGCLTACTALLGYDDFQKTTDKSTTTPKNHTASSGATGDDDDATSSSSSSSGGVAIPTCDLTKPFGAPTLLPGSLNGASFEEGATLTADELQIAFLRATGGTTANVMIATRPSVADPFGDPTVVTSPGTANLYGPSMSADGLTLFWSIVLNPGTASENEDIRMATRKDTTSAFGTAVDSPWANQNYDETYPDITPDGTEFYFSTDKDTRNTDHRLSIYRSVKGNDGTWSAPTSVSELNSTASTEGEMGTAVSHDGLTIYLGSDRPGGQGAHDIYVAHRSKGAAWGALTLVPEVSSDAEDFPSYVSKDGCRLYLGSNRGGTAGQLYVATKPK